MDRIEIPGAQRAQIVTIHYTRRNARKLERTITSMLSERSDDTMNPSPADYELAALHFPKWAMGARVVKAGTLSWAVVATDTKGH